MGSLYALCYVADIATVVRKSVTPAQPNLHLADDQQAPHNLRRLSETTNARYYDPYLVLIRSLAETYTTPTLPDTVADTPFAAPFADRNMGEVAQSLRDMAQATGSDLDTGLFIVLDEDAEESGVVTLVQARTPEAEDESRVERELEIEFVRCDFQAVEALLYAVGVEKPSMDELQDGAKKTSDGIEPAPFGPEAVQGSDALRSAPATIMTCGETQDGCLPKPPRLLLINVFTLSAYFHHQYQHKSSMLQYVAHHLLSRRDNVGITPADPEDPNDPANIIKRLDVSPGGAVLMFFTFLAFVVLFVAVHYTLSVVLTVAFVEHEQPAAPPNSLAPPAYSDTEDGELESAVVRTDATTSSIRRTISHLRSIAGWRSLFRGFACAVCYGVTFNILAGVSITLLRLITFGKIPWLDQFIGSMVACFALVHWQTAWTHIVISEPSQLKWIQRVPQFRRTLRNVWQATAVHELATRMTHAVPMGIFLAMGIHNINNDNVGKTIGKSIVPAIVMLILYVSLVIPASVTLARVQASMLPDEDETIVPFDRSFAGKVDPAIVGGSGAISFLDAWKSLDRRARMRIVKLCFKVILIEVVVYIVFAVALAIELACFVRPKEEEGAAMM